MHKFYRELEDIHYKYERLKSLIGILQMFTAETVANMGIPSDSLADALFEIEIGMEESNDRLKRLFTEKGGMIHES